MMAAVVPLLAGGLQIAVIALAVMIGIVVYRAIKNRA